MFGGNPNHYYDWATSQGQEVNTNSPSYQAYQEAKQERDADTSSYNARVAAADQEEAACSHEYKNQQVYAGHFENVCTKCGKKQ